MAKVKMRIESHMEIKTKISGVTHDDPVTGINRQKLIKDHIKPGVKLTPKAEPDNPYDPGAVGLWCRVRIRLMPKDVHIGYIGKTHSAYVAEKLREGKDVTVTVLDVTGGSKDKPSFGVYVVIKW